MGSFGSPADDCRGVRENFYGKYLKRYVLVSLIKSPRDAALVGQGCNACDQAAGFLLSLSVSCCCRGTVNRKTDPDPGSLSAPMLPPINSTNCLQMASPSPVPPYFLVVEPSACTKGWNNFPNALGAIPMPVSATENRT